jgi:hypothetical protein
LQVLETIQKLVGATSVYLGKKLPPPDDGEDGEGSIQYIETTPDCDFMKSMPMPVEEGVTADVWKPIEVDEDEGKPHCYIQIRLI